jgi:hypothetical protein
MENARRIQLIVLFLSDHCLPEERINDFHATDLLPVVEHDTSPTQYVQLADRIGGQSPSFRVQTT